MHPMLNIAVKAARRAGAIINRASQDIGTLTVKSKNFNDFVSEVDVAAERAIIDTLKEVYPTHGFLGEESGSTAHTSDFIWIIWNVYFIPIIHLFNSTSLKSIGF